MFFSNRQKLLCASWENKWISCSLVSCDIMSHSPWYINQLVSLRCSSCKAPKIQSHHMIAAHTMNEEVCDDVTSDTSLQTYDWWCLLLPKLSFITVFHQSTFTTLLLQQIWNTLCEREKGWHKLSWLFHENWHEHDLISKTLSCQASCYKVSLHRQKLTSLYHNTVVISVLLQTHV